MSWNYFSFHVTAFSQFKTNCDLLYFNIGQYLFVARIHVAIHIRCWLIYMFYSHLIDYDLANTCKLQTHFKRHYCQRFCELQYVDFLFIFLFVDQCPSLPMKSKFNSWHCVVLAVCTILCDIQFKPILCSPTFFKYVYWTTNTSYIWERKKND